MRTKALALLTGLSATCLLALSGFAQSTDGAKGLFFEQLQAPTSQLNTGVRYYIELVRNGQSSKVNNRIAFRTGDKIRFHVQPNIDGFAYILLKSGSQGEQSVLFPDPNRAEDNAVKRGKDYVLPYDGFLTFDKNPGVEKVTLLLSRMPLDATAYLANPDGERTLVACAETGSKDLIPSKIRVAYAPTVVAVTTPAAPVAAAHVAEATQAAQKAIAAAPAKQTKTPKATQRAKKPSSAKRKTPPVAPDTQPDPNITVVNQDPHTVLAVDVALEHN
jgi:hypothetical protein